MLWYIWRNIEVNLKKFWENSEEKFEKMLMEKNTKKIRENFKNFLEN